MLNEVVILNEVISTYCTDVFKEQLSVNIDPQSAQVQNLILLIFGSSKTLNE